MALNVSANSISSVGASPLPGGTTPLAQDPGNQVSQEPIGDSLAHYVRQNFLEAEMYRRVSGVEERLLKALRALRYVYDPEDAGLIGGIDVYIGLISLKVRAAVAWINDILLSSIDKPWVLDPTPIPNLPEWMKEQVVDALELELQQAGVPFDLRQRAKELKDAALKYATEQSKAACGRMEQKIEDQLLEGGWRDCFAEVIQDFCTFPAAFFRSPIISNKRRLEWDGTKVTEKTDTIYSCRRISPFDAYPSLESTTPQNGRYFIERRKMGFDELYLCLGLEGFNEEAIRQLLNQYRNTGYEEQLRPDFQRKFLQDTYTPTLDRKTLDTLIYNGKISGKLLLENNVMCKDAEAEYEVEIWTVNNQTIKAILNPYPLQARPIFSSTFVKVPGSLWGEGLADILRPTQKVVNSCARAIVRNMSYSSGPIGEVDVDRLAEGEIPDEIFPYKLYHVETDPTGKGGSAYRFTVIPSVTPALLEVWNKFSQVADDLSGVPPYVMGSMAVAGAGRTMGGLSMMMANAAKGIKNSILNLDRDVIEPSIEFRYNMNMVYDDDPDIKADAQVVARGATGILQRELAQARTVELLGILQPYTQSTVPGQEPAIPPQGVRVMLREILKQTGLPVNDIVPNPDQLSGLLSSLGAAGGDPQQIAAAIAAQLGGGNPSTASALQTGASVAPRLDARSSVPSQPGALPAPSAPNAAPSGGSSLQPLSMASGA
jgi:hypothetical protein